MVTVIARQNPPEMTRISRQRLPTGVGSRAGRPFGHGSGCVRASGTKRTAAHMSAQSVTTSLLVSVNNKHVNCCPWKNVRTTPSVLRVLALMRRVDCVAIRHKQHDDKTAATVKFHTSKALCVSQVGLDYTSRQ